MRSTCLIFVGAFVLTTLAATEIDIALYEHRSDQPCMCGVDTFRTLAMGVALMVCAASIPGYLLFEWGITGWKQRPAAATWVGAALVGALWPLLCTTGALSGLPISLDSPGWLLLVLLGGGFVVGLLSSAAVLGLGRLCGRRCS